MQVLRWLLRIIAILAILMGLLWIGQGTGLILWPSSSFMLAQPKWAVNGSSLAGVGVIGLLLLRGRRS